MVDPAWLDRVAWPYPPRELALADGRVHYVSEGDGPPVVLVHGTPTWSFEWRHTLPVLSPNHRVIAADHLGFGLSERPAGASYSPEAHSARFAEMMAALVPKGPVALVVHDYGGPIALDWALENVERLSHLVIVNTWMWPLDDDPVMRRRAELARGRLARFLYRRANASLRIIMPSAYGDRRKLTSQIHAQYLNVFPDADSRERVLFALAQGLLGSTDFYANLWKRRERLTRVPATILWGVADSAFGPAFLERWRTVLPQARVLRFERAGHWPHEEEPQAFNTALVEALG